MTKVGPRPLAVATALLLLFSLVALATVDEGNDTHLTAAADATRAKGTTRVALTISFETAGLPPQTTMSGEAVVDMQADRVRMTVSSRNLGEAMDLLVDGTTTYVNAATVPHFKALAGGKPWVRIDTKTVGTAGFAIDALGGSTDPMLWFRLLETKGVAGDLREKGVEDVRGTSTTRYAAALDVSAVLRAVGSDPAGGMANSADAPGELEVWQADDGTIRRTVFRMGFAGVAVTVTMELFDFGVAADSLKPPPAEQVYRL